MQPRDGSVQFDPLAASSGEGESESGGEDDAPPDSIRERQRRRRNASRARPDLTAVLSQTEGDEDEEDEDEADLPPPAPPARVFVVFRGVSWEDPAGGLRESDNIMAVYATEEAARRAVAVLRGEGGETAESWFQPYAVQE